VIPTPTRGISVRDLNNRAYPDSVPSDYRTEKRERSDVINDYAQELGLDSLPNDLTRFLYLASLRDCNSGCYLHPQLSQRIGMKAADEALRACHDQVFRCLLITSTSGYIQQLDEYIRYTRTDRTAVLQTWQLLQAYRATVPLRALPIYCELFCLNIELALIILGPRAPTNTMGSQHAISRCV
jgi:hypothetical protein